MKYWVVLLFVFTSANAFSQKSWSSLKKGDSYKTTRSFNLFLDEREFSFQENTKLTLKETIKDNSIKVYIHKFNVSPCPGKNIQSDLELIEVPQQNGVSSSVGVSLSRGCSLEVFVDMSEYNTLSFLK